MQSGSQTVLNATLAVVVIVGTGCASPPLALAGPGPELVLRDVRVTRLADGVVGRGHAEELRVYRAEGLVEADAPWAELPGRPVPAASRGAERMSAASARLSLGEHARLDAAGGVRLVTALGDVVDGADAHYAADARTLTTSHPVRARGPGYRLDADGLTAQVDTGEVRLEGGVHVVGLPPLGVAP